MALFVVYAAGACRTIYVGDSGELVAAVHGLGIPHPSGYPLYVLLGKLFTLLVPMGSIAFRMSLFSAACGALACGVFHLACRRLGLSGAAAATASLSLGLSPSFWGEANVQRVYTLNACFVALASAAFLAWHRTRADRALLSAAFLCGLGAANHTFMAVMAVALFACAAWSAPRLLLRPRLVAGAAAALAAGLLPYAYLPLRARAHPPLNWGDPETLTAFLDVVLRREFWNRAWWEGPADGLLIGADYLTGLAREFGVVGVALALLGAALGLRRRWPVLFPLLVMAGNLAALAAHGSRTDIFVWHRYYIPSYMMMALLIGYGCQRLVELRQGLAWALLGLPLFALWAGYGSFDRSRYRLADDFSRTLLGSLPPGAHLSANDDNILFVLVYLHFVEDVRPDVDLILQGVGDAHTPTLRFNPDSEPLYFTHHPNWTIPELELVPMGLVFQARRAGRPHPEPLVAKDELAGEGDPRVPRDYLTQNLVGHFHYMLGVTFEQSDWPRAAREFRLAQRVAPDNDVLFFNLGLIYRRNGLLPEAMLAFERSAAINPRPIPGGSRVRASEHRDQVAAERREQEALEAGLRGELGEALSAGSPEYHRRLAELLRARGALLWARGHLLRAAERQALPR